MEGYTRHNGRRKPELMSPDTYSLLNYAEAERVLTQLQQLTDAAEALAKNSRRTSSRLFSISLTPGFSLSQPNPLKYSGG